MTKLVRKGIQQVLNKIQQMPTKKRKGKKRKRDKRIIVDTTVSMSDDAIIQRKKEVAIQFLYIFFNEKTQMHTATCFIIQVEKKR